MGLDQRTSFLVVTSLGSLVGLGWMQELCSQMRRHPHILRSVWYVGKRLGGTFNILMINDNVRYTYRLLCWKFHNDRVIISGRYLVNTWQLHHLNHHDFLFFVFSNWNRNFKPKQVRRSNGLFTWFLLPSVTRVYCVMVPKIPRSTFS